MKKNVVKMLAGIMVIGLLTACGKEESTSGVDVNTGVQSEADAVIDEPAVAPAEQQEASADEFQFEEEEGALVLTAYNGTAASVTIPDSKDGKAVVVIGDRAFSQNESIEEVIIPDSVTEVREGAFKMCSNLSKVTLGNSTKIVGEEAFYMNADIVEMNFPNSITEIGENAFANISVKDIVISSQISILERGVFGANRAIEKVVIPGNVKSIGEIAFASCENLKEVELKEGVETIEDSAFGDNEILFKVIIPASVTTINEYAFMDSKSQLTIIAPAGSYAEQYAAEQEIAFQAQ